MCDTTNYNCSKALTGHTAYVMTIEVLSDGTFVSGSNDFTVIIWNANSGAQVKSFNPLNLRIAAIKEISPQVIAIGFDSNRTVVFYRVNGTMTPVLIKSIDLPSQINLIYSMLVATLSIGGVTSKILYAGSTNNTVVFNVTDLNNITYTIAPIPSTSTMLAFEKLCIIVVFFILFEY